MNVAVVDIGSNSTRLLIAGLEDHRVAELVRRSEITRLGAGVDADGRLREDAMERVFRTLDGYRAEIDEHGCERAVAVLTSAVRDSANGRQFAEEVRDRYGLEPHVLSGDDEARLFLRRCRRRELLRIGYNDIVRGFPLELITQDLSHLADACVEAAARLARSHAEERYGVPMTPRGLPARAAAIDARPESWLVSPVNWPTISVVRI